MYPKSFKKLIDHFAALPSVGPKMAERLVLYLFKQNSETLSDFGETIAKLKTNLRHCRRCGHLAEGELCDICKNTHRDQKTICVVEEPLDIFAIEKTKKYAGLYHVLGGTLGIGKTATDNLKIAELEKRVRDEKTEEVILAMNPTTVGDATSLYVAKTLHPLGVKVTKLARGLSTGGDIEYADELTLGSAILNRK
ncbi:MAG: recombination mediator RecR [Candidatus Pacebacteria bacterium]|nr:recombination mediator RecR [Candidatus Paceibacterota bacterium]